MPPGSWNRRARVGSGAPPALRARKAFAAALPIVWTQEEHPDMTVPTPRRETLDPSTASSAPAPGQCAPSAREWAARLPFELVLGPYHVAVELRPRRSMADGRRRVCLNLEAHRIELRQGLTGWALAEAFLESIVRLAHFSKGCQQGCIEEAYTHSLATGLMEFAQRNPRAWLWFNLLLSQLLPGRCRHDRAVRGVLASEPPLPRRVLIAGEPVRVRVISRAACGAAFGWYDGARREVLLCAGLAGCHLPIVALHEFTHALHHAHGLDDGAPHRHFTQAQVSGWLRFVRDNPGAWRWLAWSMSFPARARTGPATPA
ncbi:MAG: hypothetical protein RI988_4028 [Pseudomonadota bacterium]